MEVWGQYKRRHGRAVGYRRKQATKGRNKFLRIVGGAAKALHLILVEVVNRNPDIRACLLQNRPGHRVIPVRRELIGGFSIPTSPPLRLERRRGVEKKHKL